MTENILTLIVSVAALLIAMITFLMLKTRKDVVVATDTFNSRPLQFQAYERMILLAERIAIPSIVNRASTSNPSTSASEMRQLLVESIKQEYEYNVSQQIYTSTVAWESITKLKDQNILIINQVASTLPADASGQGLNRTLLEFTLNYPQAQLHTVVLEAINYEAKQLMT